MKSMAGIAVIAVGVIFIVVGIFILVNKNTNEIGNIADATPIKQKARIIEPRKIDVAKEYTPLKQLETKTQLTSLSQKNNQEKETVPNSRENAEKKGVDFEKYVVQRFSKKYFTLKQWTGDKFINGIYAENTLGPDLVYQFSLKEISEGLAIECKWRRKLYDNFNIISAQQIKNYKKFEIENGIPVFIVIGVGGEPSSPEQLYIIPLSRIDSTDLNKSFLREFQQEVNRNVFYDFKAKTLTAKDTKVKEEV